MDLTIEGNREKLNLTLTLLKDIYGITPCRLSTLLNMHPSALSSINSISYIADDKYNSLKDLMSPASMIKIIEDKKRLLTLSAYMEVYKKALQLNRHDTYNKYYDKISTCFIVKNKKSGRCYLGVKLRDGGVNKTIKCPSPTHEWSDIEKIRLEVLLLINVNIDSNSKELNYIKKYLDLVILKDSTEISRMTKNILEHFELSQNAFSEIINKTPAHVHRLLQGAKAGSDIIIAIYNDPRYLLRCIEENKYLFTECKQIALYNKINSKIKDFTYSF